MKSVDLNLLIALDALLDKNSVSAAAERLHTSMPTMSRTLARLRRALGDPILVRAGQQMVPTPRALAVRDQVRSLVEQAQWLFSDTGEPDLATLKKTFTVQAHDMAIATLAQPLLEAVQGQAPNITVRFVADDSNSTSQLREGATDLEIGVVSAAFPEVNSEQLMVDRVVGVVRAGHPLAHGTPTVERFAAAQHVSVSRRGRLTGPIDQELAEHGLRRQTVCAVPSWIASLHMIAATDLVGIAPELLSRDAVRRLDLRTFAIPLPLPSVVISQSWHARYQADAAHAWFRRRVRDLVADLAS